MASSYKFAKTCTGVNIIQKTIMPRIIMNNCAFLLFWPLIFCTFIRAEKEILKGMIRDGDSKIHINWKQTKQLLVNEHLPVWFANTYVQKFCRFPLCRRIHELQQNFVKKHIGEFIFYHDIETMSAVVYFKNTKTICGVVDIRYIIRDMPISECDQGHQVGGPYVKLRDNTLNVHDHLKMFGFPTHGNDDSSQDEDELGSPGGYEIPRKRQRLYDYSDERRVTTLYPEILIFVPYNMIEYVKQFIGLMSAPAHILKYYIVHFNCIDMLLAKLSTNQIKIHLNIAGIVFEGQDNIFDFMKYINVPFGVHGSNPIRYIDASSTFESIASYINKNQITFPEDSYDFYFIPTGAELLVNGDVCAGASIELDYYKIRKTVPSLIRNRIGMLVQHSIESDYVITAHELGHLMFLKHEPQTKGYQNGIKQCYAIMQETYPYCIDCLKWTKENIEDLKKFVKDNRNHCFLLNKPRSLHPHGQQIKMLSRLDQCRCYGFEHWPMKDLDDYIDEVPQTGCDQELICGENSHEVNTILPFDGTPCATNKVCWNRACQVISDLGGLPTVKHESCNLNE